MNERGALRLAVNVAVVLSGATALIQRFDATTALLAFAIYGRPLLRETP